MLVFDRECVECGWEFEHFTKRPEDEVFCPICITGKTKKVFKQPLIRSWIRRPQDRILGTSRISSSLKMQEKRKGGRKDG